nr:MAG TPA: hypothetical protein [Ackermannviridae sp.]
MARSRLRGRGGRGISLRSRCFLAFLRINKNILFNLIFIKHYNECLIT